MRMVNIIIGGYWIIMRKKLYKSKKNWIIGSAEAVTIALVGGMLFAGSAYA